MSVNHEFTWFLGPDWTEVEIPLQALYAYSALLLAFALKGVSRLQMIAAWLAFALFCGTFWYA